jgi:hypothetical protein
MGQLTKIRYRYTCKVIKCPSTIMHLCCVDHQVRMMVITRVPVCKYVSLSAWVQCLCFSRVQNVYVQSTRQYANTTVFAQCTDCSFLLLCHLCKIIYYYTHWRRGYCNTLKRIYETTNVVHPFRDWTSERIHTPRTQIHHMLRVRELENFIKVARFLITYKRYYYNESIPSTLQYNAKLSATAFFASFRK